VKRAIVSYLAICITLVLLLVPSAGCQFMPDVDISPSPPATGQTPTSTATPLDPDWTLPATQGQLTILPSIADVVAKVRPAVVAINTEVVTFDIFNRAFTQEGAGSGWVIDESGIIVTNNHVVEDAKSVTATLSDDRVFPVEMVRTDPLNDLAVGKINAEGLTAVPIGDSSSLRVGDWVVAIGNPLGLGISAKEGIVSRIGVPISLSAGQSLYNLIETSAAINPGNSGGPLVNMAGEVIGITSAKIATIGVEGLGYAINISDAAPIIQELVTTGYVVRPWLGVVFYTVDEGVAARYGLSVNQGVLVTEVGPDSPADKAGLKRGDVIVVFDSKEITDRQDLLQAIHSSQIGQSVTITYWREDTRQTTTATLIESPPPP
jgi:serine protease Do